MALQPPADHSGGYHAQQGRPFEVPILETNPVTRNLPHVASPYSSYAEQGRDRSERYFEAPTGSYTPNGNISPYAATGTQDVSYQSPGGTFNRAPGLPYVPPGADSQKKYIGVKEVPGEGSYHLYEGGYRIPTHVDGEQVNPAWGLTKANKPRKRLALACLDCREKKIKCEPGATSCLQCEKAKRTCRRAPAQLSHSDTASTTWPESGDSSVRKGASISDPNPITNRNIESDSLNKRRSREDTSPPNVPSKKQRSASPISTMNETMAPQEHIQNQPRQITPPLAQASPQAMRKSPLAWEDDPYELEPEVTLHLVDLYFAHVNNAAYCIYPRGPFLYWLKNFPEKCQNERMVLYAMLATASIFADVSLSSLFGKQCARVAEDAVSTQLGKSNIAVAHTKMLLAVYHFSKGSTGLAWDYVGSAIRTISFMRLNTEEGCLDDKDSMAQARTEFYFSREQLAECKRRLFWSGFLMDRECGAPSCLIKPQDIFLRLPCTDDMFERSIASDVPYFPNETLDPTYSVLTPASPIAPMAWLVLVAGMWGDVNDFIFRTVHRPASSYRETYESFYNDFSNRSQGWLSRLPEHLLYSEANLDRSIQQGYTGTFVSMHAVHHLAHMKLNRYLRHSAVPEFVYRNIRAAHHHSHELLEIMKGLRVANRQIHEPSEGQPRVFSFSTPFPGYATLAAIDIVSAGGRESNVKKTLEEIDSGLACLRELSNYWSSATDQSRACQKRFYQIQTVLTSGSKARSGAWLGRNWGLELPLEQEFQQDDCIYGLGDSPEAIQTYFDALAEGEGRGKAPQGGLRIA
ncbi:hypothetical protein LTR37_012006 [Vermiconidia calcicola]|uniref:Uncharacterized protein n=1 Tax=Vermiconidia calcicola TaxID=1690605 RepID=A0ACC3N1V8_9PEZI|nr:hypothetical protein LTR37_012006 [Vermiconidia calcicola]